MGHMLKNTVFKSGSYALGVPTGTSSIGPSPAANGQTRYNTTTGKLEFYNNSVWNAVAKEGNVTIVADTSFVGTGSQTLFEPMSYTYSSGQEAQVLVFVGTVYQIPVINYTFAGNTSIQFVSPPSGSAAITILHNFASTVTA
jgi:hypothetical protein